MKELLEQTLRKSPEDFLDQFPKEFMDGFMEPGISRQINGFSGIIVRGFFEKNLEESQKLFPG